MAAETIAQEPDMIEFRARRFDLRALWRLTGWGVAAAVALTVAAFFSQTENGSQRLELALARAALPVKPVATVKIPPRAEQDAEIARLETQVRRLAADRDRLAERVASLEHNIEDMTGSINRQAAPAIPPMLSKVPVPAISPPGTADPKQSAKEPTTFESAKPQAEASSPDQSPPAAPEQAPPTSPSAAVPMPPVRVAAAPATAPVPPKSEFGVALAGASSVDIMRLQWVALKANYGPLLAGLRPIAAREQHGSTTHYRLVAGPLPNYAAAARLCARLNAAHAACHAGKFAGEPF
jgi:hypothetical protein